MSAARPTPVDQRIRRDIADAIFAQRLAPGTRLSETGLGEIYGVSRTVVRKALFALASDKLVDLTPNRGARVGEPSPAEAREVFAARRVLETSLLAEGMAHMHPADHEALAACVAADVAAQAADDRQAMIRASGDFHRRLAAPAGHTVLLEFLDELIGRSSLIVALYERAAHAPCSHSDHHALLSLVIAGDGGAAQAALAEHLDDCVNRLDLVPVTPRSPTLAELLGPARNP